MFGYVIIMLVFISIFLITYLVFISILGKQQAVKIRLENITKMSIKNVDTELNQPFFIRFIRPMLDNISKTILKITPAEMVTSFEKKVEMAGNPYNLSIKDWLNIQVISILCLPVITIAIGYYAMAETRKMVFLVLCEIGVGLLFPNLILSKKQTERQKQITNSLPDIIDLLTVSVEAGLSFDGALTKVIEKMPGPLAKEFENVLQEMKVGKQKKDALKDMSDRIGVQDLTTFVGSIVQADQFGVSIGHVLRIQSEQIRQKRRQRAQEKAMKAPVKMLIPMIIFIFPTIFAVLLGPAVIKLVDMFTNW